MEDSGTMLQNMLSLPNLHDESNPSNDHNESSRSSDGDSICFVETTIIEMEELLGDEEELQSFIDLMSRQESPPPNSHFKINSLDQNCNEIKEPIPIIDISDDDDSSEFDMISGPYTNETTTQTLTEKSLSPKSLTSVSITEKPNPVNISEIPSVLCNSLGVTEKPNLVSILETPSVLCTSTKSINNSCIDAPHLMPLELCDENSNILSLADSGLLKVADSGLLKVADSELLKVASPSPRSEALLLEEDETEYSVGVGLLEEASPSPRSEALLLEEDETQHSVVEVSPKVALATEPASSCQHTNDLSEEAFVVGVLPPPPSPQSVDAIRVELLQENKDLEPSNASCPPSLLSSPTGTGLSEVVSPASEEVHISEKCLSGVPQLAPEEVPGFPEILASQIQQPEKSPGAATVDAFQSEILASQFQQPEKSPGAATVDAFQPESTSSEEKPSWAIPWISTDEAENKDNNDPEWQVLKKLETDEERYRVVRKKWRQLSIPDPRRDLTCHNFQRAKKQALRKPLNGTVREQSKKRARSPEGSDNEERPSKRRRLFSCTQMFDNKINVIRRQLESEFENLSAQHDRKLLELSASQQEEQQRLLKSTAPYYELQAKFDRLFSRQAREVDALRDEFDDKLNKAHRYKDGTINLLHKASQEVLAFNKFYNNLESSEDDHCFITEEEFQQFEETEQMYELYDQFYSE